MKLSKLLKKITVAVSIIMIAGMLAACSSPSGSSSGSGSGSNNGNNNSTQQPGTGGDGGNDAGKDSSGYSTYSGVRDGYYSLWYNGNCLGYVKESGYALMMPGLNMITPDDYTVDETDKKVIFTASGYTKFMAAASNS